MAVIDHEDAFGHIIKKRKRGKRGFVAKEQMYESRFQIHTSLRSYSITYI